MLLDIFSGRLSAYGHGLRVVMSMLDDKSVLCGMCQIFWDCTEEKIASIFSMFGCSVLGCVCVL